MLYHNMLSNMNKKPYSKQYTYVQKYMYVKM